MQPRRRTRLPRPLLLLLVVVAVFVAAWALLVPPWQSPDENAHFGYAQVLAERFDLPGFDPDRPAFSFEQLQAQIGANTSQTAHVLATKPEWSETAYREWQLIDRGLDPEVARDSGGGSANGRLNSARSNPPLYYLAESIPYLAGSAGDIFDRLYLMRLWSGLLLLVTTTAAWLLVGELFGRDRLLQLVGAALAGLEPMATFISASVNPDALLIAASSLVLWLGARVIKRGLTVLDAALLFALSAVAVLAKGAGYALVPPAVAALLYGLWRLRRSRGAKGAAAVAAAALVFTLPVGGWILTARSLDRAVVNQVPGVTQAASDSEPVNANEFASYLWQFYLPRAPFMREFEAIVELPVWDVWVKTGWASFGWLEVQFPDAVYALLAVATAALLMAGAIGVLRLPRPRNRAVLAFLALATLSLLGGLHWTEYRIATTGGGPFNQGRYLLPLLPILSVAGAGALSLLKPGRRPLGGALLLGGLLALQVFSLALTAGRFYA